MESELSKVVRRHFIQELAAALPQFEPQGGKGKVATPGWRSFIWTVRDDLHFFIGLGFDGASGSFTVEGGWNDMPEYPGHPMLHVLPEVGKSPADKVEMLFRAGATAAGGTLMERRWRQNPAVDEKEIEAQVREAVRLVQTEFVPLYRERAERKGIALG
ncbi:MAG: hypothetical protein U0793_07065 [Gemmataceae bacterium]